MRIYENKFFSYFRQDDMSVFPRVGIEPGTGRITLVRVSSGYMTICIL